MPDKNIQKRAKKSIKSVREHVRISREKFGPSCGWYCIRIARALTLTLLLNRSNVITLVLNNVSDNVIT